MDKLYNKKKYNNLTELKKICNTTLKVWLELYKNIQMMFKY